jgi:uncharacterized protein with von Willebrand factor type A (vWA) domain
VARVDLADLAARFADRLRAEGLVVGPDRCTRFAQAVSLVDATLPDPPDTADPPTLRPPMTVTDLYWCARVTLVADPAELPVFDRVFNQVFAGGPPPLDEPPPSPPARPDGLPPMAAPVPLPTLHGGRATVGAAQGPAPGDADDGEPRPALAAAAERLGSRDFASLTPDELAELVVVMRRLTLATPLRRSRRYEAGSRGRRIDLRTTLRRAQRTGGFPVRLARHRLRLRRRRLVVLCDISGSMEPYARAMLQLLYSAVGAGLKTEVFTFATRLTRLTRVLAKVKPEVALARAGRAAPDWSGGTRIGEALAAFIDRYGARGLARGAIVLVISDGWETGDATVLGEQMARLGRLAYRVVWANPRTAAPGYQPLVAGMAAAWPHCDSVVSAHSLAALDDLLAALRQE